MTISDALELLIRYLLRPITGRAAYLIVLFGLYLISPSLIVDIINLLLEKFDAGQLPVSEPMPRLGATIFCIGVVLILVSHFWAPRQTTRETIGIRHNSLGSFSKEDVRKDLPIPQRLATYREIDVDHSDSYTNGLLTDHQSILRRLNGVPQELRGLLGSSLDSRIAYYGLPHVPLAFYLGYLLSDNKYKVELYDLNNETGRWNQLFGKDESLETTITGAQLPYSEDPGDVLVSIGISYPVNPVEIAELGLPNVLGTVELNARQPQRQLITNRNQVNQICSEFRRTLELIKNRLPNRQRIHIFYAGPASLCFALGRCINERIDPEIVVYNYSAKTKPRYSWALSLNHANHTSATFHSMSPKGEEHAPVQHA